MTLFYWFEIRPSTIRKNCSWFTETIPADAGITKEQADLNKNAYAQCHTEKLIPFSCWLLGQDSTERPPQPERENTRPATKGEYDACLRQNGL